MPIPSFDPNQYDWSDLANPQPIIGGLGGFAAHIANPANIAALAPSLAPQASIKPQPAPDFFNANSNLLQPPAPSPAPAAPDTSWFKPSAQPSTTQPQVAATIPQVAMQGVTPPSASPQVDPSQMFGKTPSQTQNDQSELQRINKNGAGLNQINNPVLRTLARIGDVAGTIFAPGVATVLPGTTLHNRALQNIQQGRIQNDVTADQARQQALKSGLDAQDTQAQIAQRTAQTAQIPILTRAKQMQAQQMGASKGLKPTFDDNGNQTGWEPDETSPVYQKQKVATDVMESQIALKQAQTELAKSKNDPNSPAYKQAAQRLAIAQQNAGAAQTRAQAYMGNYLQGAYNTGLNGQTLPGAPQIANDQGGVSAVGSKNASSASKAQSNTAQFNDVYGALDSADSAADALVKSGGKLNSPAVIQAFKQPKGTIGQYLQSEIVKGNLTPAERDYVTALQAAHENVQAMRKSAGGTATDSSVAKLDALIPNESTPDIDYFKRQTKQIRNTANRLSTGVTTASGGLNVNRGGAQETKMYQGHTYVKGASGWQLQK